VKIKQEATLSTINASENSMHRTADNLDSNGQDSGQPVRNSDKTAGNSELSDNWNEYQIETFKLTKCMFEWLLNSFKLTSLPLITELITPSLRQVALCSEYRHQTSQRVWFLGDIVP